MKYGTAKNLKQHLTARNFDSQYKTEMQAAAREMAKPNLVKGLPIMLQKQAS